MYESVRVLFVSEYVCVCVCECEKNTGIELVVAGRDGYM